MTKVFLKQKKSHPKGFRLGRHIITAGAPKEYNLNKEEMAELKTVGPQHWLQVVTKEQMDKLPKSNEENRKNMAERKKKIDSLEMYIDDLKEQLTKDDLSDNEIDELEKEIAKSIEEIQAL